MNDKNETPKIIRLVETDSTNNYLREQSAKARLPEGSLVIADFQTAGKGQVGNSWESEAGKNLMFSILLYPDFLPANRQFLISQIASLSVKETLEKYTDSVTVKWPNDIYWKDRKICGMLIENDLSGQHLYCSVVGIGLNINQEIFRSDAPNPVSLTQITGKTYDREDVLVCFLRIFFNYYHGDGYYFYIDENGSFEACIHAIEPTGHLILQLRDGERRRYAFKEVTTVVPR